jgi:hypothetical protein
LPPFLRTIRSRNRRASAREHFRHWRKIVGGIWSMNQQGLSAG